VAYIRPEPHFSFLLQLQVLWGGKRELK
jgi:hypothetical protein